MQEQTALNVPAFLKWIDGLDGSMMFRGQGSRWPLLPSIARPQLSRQLKGYSNWQVFQRDLIEHFAKHSRSDVQSQPKDIEKWLVHGQHHGLSTRLLDWTTNPLKALFWAVEDSSSD